MPPADERSRAACAELASILSGRYDTTTSIKRLLDLSQLDPAGMDLDGPTSQVWGAILARLGGDDLLRLIERVREDYRRNSELHGRLAEIKKELVRGGSLPPRPPSSPPPPPQPPEALEGPPWYPLNSEHGRQFREALTDAFTTPTELRMMVTNHIDDRITKHIEWRTLDAAAFELIERMKERGRARALFDAARRANPTNPSLVTFGEMMERAARATG